MNSVKRIVLEKLSEGAITKQEAMDALTALSEPKETGLKEIAIIGMSCRFAMSPDVGQFWDNLVNNRNCFVSKPAEKLVEDRVFENAHYAEFYDRVMHSPEMEDLERYVGPYLADADKFDAQFFGISDTEADTMDPQHRVFLEQAWSALEDAGYSEDQIRGSRTGCFVGRDGTNSNFYRHMVGPESAYLGGIWEGILASRINYHFDLRGPSYVVDTACSSSLVAMQMAMHHLSTGEIEMAIAGGVSLTCGGTDNDQVDIDDLLSRDIAPGSVVAADNRIRSFDAKAAGSVFGEGASVVILKTLEAAERDGDHIYGIVPAIATNSDGASNGLTAPNPRAQADLIVDAWKRAGIDGAAVEYVETHGTGTPLGDPIEVLGLTNAFAQVTTNKQFCGIGSAKSNIGHTIGAAGVAGVIKVLLAMQHEVIPASVNFEEPNPHIDFPNSPVYVVDRNTAWPRRDTPRYAGVSSFGFSGTNAHVVLRDHRPTVPVAAATARPRLFTVSAKTETAFRRYLDSYDRYFAAQPTAPLEDISFTSTCGRGHFEYRLVVVASTVEELRTKLAESRVAGWSENPARGVFVGSHRVVSDRKLELARGEVRERDLGDLNRAGERIISELAETDGLAAGVLARELARNYVLGAAVDFPALYGGTGRRASLPTYPFEKTPHWGVPRTSKIAPERAESGTPVGQSLVTRLLVDAGGLSVYEAALSPEEHWAVRDHVIMGHRFVAGTVLIELMLQSLRHHLGTDRIVLDDVMFLSPATAEDEAPLLVQIILHDADGTVSVDVVSRTDGDEGDWGVNARGTARVHTQAAPDRARTLAEILDDPDLIMHDVPKLNEFGPTWQSLQSIHRSASDPDDAYGVIELPDIFRDQLNDHALHPALLDNAVSMVPFLLHMKPSVYLPMAYSGLTVHRPFPQRFYCRSRRIPARGSELMSFTTELVTEAGDIIATVDQFSMKRVSELDGFVSGSHYSLTWRNLPVLESAELDTAGVILVVGGDEAMVGAIAERAMGAQILRIEFGHERVEAGIGHVTTEESEEGVAWAFERLGDIQPTRVIDLSAATPGRDTVTEDELTHLVGNGLHAFAALVRGLLARCTGSVEFVVVADHAHEITGEEPFIDAGSASRLAMLKGLRHECPSFTFTAVDIDVTTPQDAIVAESLSTVPGRVVVALRGVDRLAPELIERPVDVGGVRPVDLHADGYYLITGGLGSLGSVIASAMARVSNEPLTLVLAGRTPLPSRAAWDGLRAADPTGKLAMVIDNILDLEERGSTVHVVALDVANSDGVREALDQLRVDHGPLRGIVHAAGVAGDGFLFTKTSADVERTLAPKVGGLRALSTHADPAELDFLVSFSSMTALIGGPGQADYAAANAFLDAYTLGLRRRGFNAKSINWPGWSEVGMAADSGLAGSATFFEMLSTSSAVSAFNELLVRDVTGVVPGRFNPDIFVHVGEEFVPFGFSEAIARSIRRSQAKAKAAGGTDRVEVARIAVENIELTGKPADQFTEQERVVAYTYATVLGLGEIDVFDSFTALGGNSIAATELMRALNASFGDVLNISDMFSYSTPDEMAARIAELTGTTAEIDGEVEETFDQMLAKLESGDIDADSMREFLGK
ncbi:SDR family oxidoreductase [Cryobacterium sp. 1639]|uniref:type I polyketide synthase n=1 Tax=Cryobacterium inferilacus TaxID=2866629 RepID=UPI001C737348|nr:SDR family oxidoreductase [Cryobacterium sp. 1639]MBX0301904.1 SDR family oxidoreductase [Cryobacterium sp. 1639]